MSSSVALMEKKRAKRLRYKCNLRARRDAAHPLPHLRARGDAAPLPPLVVNLPLSLYQRVCDYSEDCAYYTDFTIHDNKGRRRDFCMSPNDYDSDDDELPKVWWGNPYDRVTSMQNADATYSVPIPVSLPPRMHIRVCPPSQVPIAGVLLTMKGSYGEIFDLTVDMNRLDDDAMPPVKWVERPNVDDS